MKVLPLIAGIVGLLPLSDVTAQPLPARHVSLALNACQGLGAIAVDSQYRATPTGEFCLNRNLLTDAGGAVLRYSFSDVGRTTPIADPSLMPFDGSYFATGTADEYGVANFPLFQSADLISWRISRFAFRESSRVGDQITIGVRSFKDLWAPHLYFDPLVNRIYLSFTATECISNVCSLAWGERIRYQSVYVSSISVAHFRSGGYFSDTADGGAAEPRSYAYTVNNLSGTRRTDGGFAQGRGLKLIPTSGHAGIVSSTCSVPGQGCVNGYGTYRAGFISFGGFNQAPIIEKRTWMHLDSFVFFDPQQGDKRYILYAFDGSPLPLFAGSGIAAYPLHGPAETDANSNELLPMAYAKNQFNGRAGALNGCADNSNPDAVCIAEGPAVFERNGWYYLLISRNDTGSSDYMVTYRKARSFAELALRSWNDQSISERVLAVSSQRGVAGGVSFGHGEVFRSKEGRHYLFIHRKDAKPDWWFHRIPVLKELSFDEATGEMLPLVDGATDPRQDLNVFLTPRQMY